ncbi:MAG: peptidylprolyl isomerase, partial [Nitrospirota bacterium]
MKKFALALVLAGMTAFIYSSAFAGDAGAKATPAATAVKADKAKTGGTAAAASEQSASKPSAKKPETVATVNGEKITSDTIDMILQQGASQGMAQPNNPEIKKTILNKLIDMSLFSQAAEKAGLKKDADYKQAVDMMKKQEGLFKKQVLSTLYLRKKAFDSVKVTPDEIKNFYDKNKDQFKVGEQVKASHILVATEAEAKAIKAKLDKGASFERMAKEKSTDPSASRGGNLGWFGKGMMDPDFEKAAFSLKKVGDISEPVKTKFGWHIIKLTGKKAASVRPLDQVKAAIEQKLMQDKQKK